MAEETQEKTTEKPRKKRFLRVAVAVLLALPLLVFLIGYAALKTGIIDKNLRGAIISSLAKSGITAEIGNSETTFSPMRTTITEFNLKNATTGAKIAEFAKLSLDFTLTDLLTLGKKISLDLDTLDVDGGALYVTFDENGKSNFSDLKFESEESKYLETNFSAALLNLNNFAVVYGDKPRKISGNAKNLTASASIVKEGENDRFKFALNTEKVDFTYEDKKVEPIEIAAKGIADANGIEFESLHVNAPIGKTFVTGTIKNWQNLVCDLNVDSTIDITKTAGVFPMETPLSGNGSFKGKIVGELANYKIQGDVTSDSLAAGNIFLKGMNVAATVNGKNSNYEANGTAVAEMLTFDDFKIDFPRLTGKIMGSGYDFKWLGELQAIAAKTPGGTLGALYVNDAIAEYKDRQFRAQFGDVRIRDFLNPDVNVGGFTGSGAQVSYANGVTKIDIGRGNAAKVDVEGTSLKDVTTGNTNLTVKDGVTSGTLGTLTAGSVETKDGRVKGLSGKNVKLTARSGSAEIQAADATVQRVESESVTAENVTAQGLDLKITDAATTVFSNSLRSATVDANSAVLGSVNLAGVRMTIRHGIVETTADNGTAETLALDNSKVKGGGKFEKIRMEKPIFVLEPQGRYRATADMSIGSGIVGSIKIGAVRAAVSATDQKVDLENLKADIMEGKVDGRATVAFSQSNTSKIEANFSSLEIGKLLALKGGRVLPITGKSTGVVDISFPGTNFNRAGGTVTADLTATAGSEKKGFVPLQGNIGLRGVDGLFDIEYAKFFSNETDLIANGRFDLSGDDSNLTVALNSKNAHEVLRIAEVLDYLPEAPAGSTLPAIDLQGGMNLSGTLTGNLSDPSFLGRFSVDSIIFDSKSVGSLNTEIALSQDAVNLNEAKITRPDGGFVAFSAEIPRAGTNNVTIAARFNKFASQDFLPFLPLTNIPQFVREIDTKLDGTVNVSGLPKLPVGLVALTSGSGTISGQPFESLIANAEFNSDRADLKDLNIKIGGGSISGTGDYLFGSTAFNAKLDGENIDLAKMRAFLPADQLNAAPYIVGNTSFTATATGFGKDTATFNVNFNGSATEVAVNENQVGTVAFKGVTQNGILTANLTAEIEGQPQLIRGIVNFADESVPLNVEMNFDNTALAPYIALLRPPDSVSITGNATGRVLFGGSLIALDAESKRVFSTENLGGVAQFSQFSATINETPLNAIEPISIRFNSREVVFENAKFSGGGSNLTISGTKALNDFGVNNFTMNGRVNMSLLNLTHKNTFYNGFADVEVRLAGVNRTARLTGTASVNGGSVSTFVGSERLTFERVQAKVIFTANQAQIESASGYLGGGKVTGTGGALVEGLSLQALRLNLVGKNVTTALPKDFLTTGDARVTVSIERVGAEARTLISGSVIAQRSVYSKNIDLADIVSARREASLAERSTSDGWAAPRFDLSIEGRDALIIRNNLADLTASANLRLTGDSDNLMLSGRVTADRGTVFFRNDRYDVQRAVLVFPPNTSFEPIIDLQAEAEIKGYQVLANLTGPLTETDALNINVRSNPALPQVDVISLITTGNFTNSTNGIPTLAQNGINTAAEILTDSLINNPTRRATDKLFGLNKFEIDPIISGQRLNPSARLTVGRQINNNLLVTYSTNLSQDQNQVLALEYRVSNRLSFVAAYEEKSFTNVTRNRDNFSFEIRLRKRF